MTGRGFSLNGIDMSIPFLEKRSFIQILLLAICGCVVVGVIDYVTAYDISVSVFYLGPVALAAWYAGRRAGIGISALSCIVWLIADVGSGHPYKGWSIPAWNTGIRFIFLLINALLLAALHAQLDVAERLSLIDPLTGVLNSRAFNKHLQSAIAFARRDGTPMTLAYIDVDNFKQINDSLGHIEGDNKLCAIGKALMDATRQTDFVARLGGDEFALLFPNTNFSGAKTILAKLVPQLATIKLKDSHVTCSIGAVIFTKPPAQSVEAMQMVDELMYTAKRGGKDAVLYGISDGKSCVRQPANTG